MRILLCIGARIPAVRSIYAAYNSSGGKWGDNNGNTRVADINAITRVSIIPCITLYRIYVHKPSKKKAGERGKKERMLYTYTSIHTHIYSKYILLYTYIGCGGPPSKWMDRHFRPFHSPFSYSVYNIYAVALPRDPPDFHFETGSDFMRCVYCLHVCECVCVLSYYTHCMVKKIKKRKSTVNREHAHTHTHTQVFRFQTVISIWYIITYIWHILLYRYASASRPP